MRLEKMKKGLSDSFRIWHPHYRSLIIHLLILGTLAGTLTYSQNYFLTSLMETLIAELQYNPLQPTYLQNILNFTGLNLAFMILLLFIASHLLLTAFEFWRTHIMGKLRADSRKDMENELLMHLLRKDDAFFSVHSPSETANRISVDIYRVCERRSHVLRVWWAGVLITGYLVFFLQKDWRLTVVVLMACAGAALWTLRMTKSVKHLDRSYLYQDDYVKSRFEDFLIAAPEIQVGRLYEKVSRNLEKLQDARNKTYMDFINLSGLLRVGDMLAALLALVSAIAILMYLRHSGEANSVLALLPVVIMSLPTLFKSTSEIIFLNVDFQLAHTSMMRLLEYESGEPETRPQDTREPAATLQAQDAAFSAPVNEAELVLDGVSYLYNALDRPRQAGVVDIDARFRPGSWTAIGGRAGSGKSTLVNLILGRLQPQRGNILYGNRTPNLWDQHFDQVFSFMPQNAALLNASIFENLFLGHDGQALPGEVSKSDLDLLERSNLGHLCRLKALEMTPADRLLAPEQAAKFADLVKKARTYFHHGPPREGYFSRDLWLLEILLDGKCQRHQALGLMISDGACRKLEILDNTPMAGKLVDWASKMLQSEQPLLELPNFYLYSQMAKTAIDERLWQLRVRLAGLLKNKTLPSEERLALYVIGLTATPADLGIDNLLYDWRSAGAFQQGSAPESDSLRKLLGSSWQPFQQEEINPFLTWRENLAFGVQDHISDSSLLEFIHREGSRDLFTWLGLQYDIGRQGGNLSGGQGQLVAFCRTLLRRTPVVILDEPTSSQDPASKINLAKMLQAYKQGRIIITVSHDRDLVSYADEVILMDNGRIATRGTFEEVMEKSELLRQSMPES